MNKVNYLLMQAAFLCAIAYPAAAAEFYFPPATGAWESVTPFAVGWDEVRLSAALDIAGERNSSGVVMLHNGRILAERYWELPESEVYSRYLQGRDGSGRAIEDVASAQKSVVAILAGMAQARGFLQLDDPVSNYLGEGWSRATSVQEQAVTIKHLLSMISGLNSDFSYAGEAGSLWLYNTPVYHATMRVLMAATGMERNELTVNWISEPIGAQYTAWTPRPWTNSAIAVGLSTTARDLARFGLMIHAGGVWDGEVVIEDKEFLTEMLSSSQELNPAYGYLWWLNGQAFSLSTRAQVTLREGSLIPSAPEDLIAMQGAGDRKLYLVPSLNLVVTRLGSSGSRPGSSFNDVFWEALIAAAPSSEL